MFALRSHVHRATRCLERLTDRSMQTPGGIRSAQAPFGERPQREIYNDPAGARAELEAEQMIGPAFGTSVVRETRELARSPWRQQVSAQGF